MLSAPRGSVLLLPLVLALLAPPAAASSSDTCRVRAELLELADAGTGVVGDFVARVRVYGNAGGACVAAGEHRAVGRATIALDAASPGDTVVFAVTRTTSVGRYGLLDHSFWRLDAVERGRCALTGRFTRLLQPRGKPASVGVRVDAGSGPAGSCPVAGQDAGLSLADPGVLPDGLAPGVGLEAAEVAPGAWVVRVRAE